MSLQFEKGVTSRKSISFAPRIDKHSCRCPPLEEYNSPEPRAARSTVRNVVAGTSRAKTINTCYIGSS